MTINSIFYHTAIAWLYVGLVASQEYATNRSSPEEKVDQLFAPYDKPGSPGCALGVIRNGNFLYKHAYGSANLEAGTPLSTQSVFDMGSISKQFTAASIVLAAEQGYLTLDDDVRKYIPELPHYGQTITLRHMLHHTSGLRDLGLLIDLSGRNNEDVHSFAEMLDLVIRQKELNFRPGEEFLYSNTNYFLLAEVVHRATGKPLSRFAEEYIFRPLGMSHTRFYDDRDSVVPGRVAAYDQAEGDTFNVRWSVNYDRVGEGGLMSSVEDLLLWDRNFYANRLGKGGMEKEMLTRGILNNSARVGYGLGVGISTYKGLPVVEHAGANFGYRTELLRFPEQNFSVVCLCNLGSTNPERLATQVADIFLAETFRDAPDHVARLDKQRDLLAGLYRNPIDHSVAEVSVISEGLRIRDRQMRSEGLNRYTSLFGRYVAHFESFGGGGTKMTFGHAYSTPQIFEKFQPIKPSVEHLGQYAGDYVSDELQATYKFRVKEGALTLSIDWTEPPPFLSPSLRDEFHAPDGTAFVFRRDSAMRITGCDIYTERVRKLSLAKK